MLKKLSFMFMITFLLVSCTNKNKDEDKIVIETPTQQTIAETTPTQQKLSENFETPFKHPEFYTFREYDNAEDSLKDIEEENIVLNYEKDISNIKDINKDDISNIIDGLYFEEKDIYNDSEYYNGSRKFKKNQENELYIEYDFYELYRSDDDIYIGITLDGNEEANYKYSVYIKNRDSDFKKIYVGSFENSPDRRRNFIEFYQTSDYDNIYFYLRSAYNYTDSFTNGNPFCIYSLITNELKVYINDEIVENGKIPVYITNDRIVFSDYKTSILDSRTLESGDLEEYNNFRKYWLEDFDGNILSEKYSYFIPEYPVNKESNYFIFKNALIIDAPEKTGFTQSVIVDKNGNYRASDIDCLSQRLPETGDDTVYEGSSVDRYISRIEKREMFNTKDNYMSLIYNAYHSNMSLLERSKITTIRKNVIHHSKIYFYFNKKDNFFRRFELEEGDELMLKGITLKHDTEKVIVNTEKGLALMDFSHANKNLEKSKILLTLMLKDIYIDYFEAFTNSQNLRYYIGGNRDNFYIFNDNFEALYKFDYNNDEFEKDFYMAIDTLKDYD